MATELDWLTARQRNGLRPEYVTSANGLPYAFRQITQWQKKRPIGRPWTAKREAPQRQAQSWFTIAFRLTSSYLG
jgi:hypothetical protein